MKKNVSTVPKQKANLLLPPILSGRVVLSLGDGAEGGGMDGGYEGGIILLYYKHVSVRADLVRERVRARPPVSSTVPLSCFRSASGILA